MSRDPKETLGSYTSKKLRRIWEELIVDPALRSIFLTGYFLSSDSLQITYESDGGEYHHFSLITLLAMLYIL